MSSSVSSRDYYEVKTVDRKLSSAFISSNCLFCDVGGNAGGDALTFVAAGAQGVCLDIDLKPLHDGRRRAKKAKLTNVSFIRASATDLPFPSEIFDAVTSFSVIDHLPSKTKAYLAIREFSRITKRRGHVIVTVPNRLFLIGTAMMAAKMFLQPESFFEQRFTPKEMVLHSAECGLQTVNYDSKYPTIIGETIIEHNLPKIVQRLPPSLVLPLFNLAVRIFQIAEGDLKLRLLGARFGLAAVKI